MTDVV